MTNAQKKALSLLVSAGGTLPYGAHAGLPRDRTTKLNGNVVASLEAAGLVTLGGSVIGRYFVRNATLTAAGIDAYAAAFSVRS